MIPLSTAQFIELQLITDIICDGFQGIPGFPHPCLTMPGETIIDSDLHVPLLQERLKQCGVVTRDLDHRLYRCSKCSHGI